jgi:hypothetical protein
MGPPIQVKPSCAEIPQYVSAIAVGNDQPTSTGIFRSKDPFCR